MIRTDPGKTKARKAARSAKAKLIGTRKRKVKSAEVLEDEAYLEWLRTQPSALSGKRPCVAAHYRTAANSGVGMKPLLSAIPLTDNEHKRQHQIGQYAFMPREWWEVQVATKVEEWKERLEHGQPK